MCELCSSEPNMRFRFMLLSIIIATATYRQRAGLCSSEPNMRFRFMHAAVDHYCNCRLQAKTLTQNEILDQIKENDL